MKGYMLYMEYKMDNLFNGMLYYSILTDRLYVVVVRFTLLKLYIIYRYTKGLCGRHPFS